MFEDFVEKKVQSEIAIIKKLPGLNKDNLLKSSLSEFSKNFLLTESAFDQSQEEISKILDKSNKLYFNYTLRPKWTLLAFLFNNFESRPPEDIIHKLDYFPFYKFYTDSIKNFLSKNAQIFITKNEIRAIIGETNNIIFEKLTADISNDKIKNFFKQLFSMKYSDETDLNLESSVPFAFIKIFLTDKSYDDLLKKFLILPGMREDQEMSLKDIIKIMSDKYSKPEKEALPEPEKKSAPAPSPESKESGKAEKRQPENTQTDKKKEPVSEKKIYSEELLKAGQKEASRINSGSLKTVISEEGIKKLFSVKLDEKITEVIYKSDLIDKSKSFLKLNTFKTWLEASEHLKGIFKKNSVDIYNKDVIQFINILEEYYKKPE